MLDQSGEADTIRRRHADFYASQAKYSRTIFPSHENVFLDFLDADHANLNAALDWCAAGDSATDVELRLVIELAQYWEARGYLSEGRGYLERILAIRDVPGDLRTQLLDALAMLAFRQGDLPAARRSLEEELALHRAPGKAAGDIKAVAMVLNHLSRVLIDAGDLAGARAICNEGLALCRDQDFSNGVAQFVNDLGELARLEGDYERAGECYLETLAIFREIYGKEGRAIAWTVHNLGYVERWRGAYAQSRAYFDEALQLFDGIGNPHGVAACLAGLAYLAVSQGQAKTAALLFGASEALRRSIGAEHQAPERVEIERGIAAVRNALPPAEFDALWGAGQRMSVEDALELARRA